MPQKISTRRAAKPAVAVRKTAKTAKKATGASRSRRSQSSLRHKRIFGLRLHHVSGVALVLIGVVWGVVIMMSQPPRHSNAATCTPDAKLVNPCRPWLAAAVDGYNTGGASQLAFFNKRLNNANALSNPSLPVNLTYKMDFPHVYHTGGQTLFNGNAQRALGDAGLYSNAGNPMLVNWKPGDKWAATANGAADSDIIASARAVKALGSRKIFLTLWHEPENHGDMNAAGITFRSGCKVPDGTRGSAADYVRMWRHVRDVFNQQGVNNVVWFVNYTGYVGVNGWDCVIKPLYPGNDYVDWIMWDPYGMDDGKFVGSISRFYNFLESNSDAQHNFTSKPWGLAEFGTNAAPALAAGYWNEGRSALGTSWNQNRFPRIKLYAVFDTSNNGGTNGGLRVGYNNSGAIDVNEQTAFNRFAQSLLNFGGSSAPAPSPTPAPTPTKDTVPPTVSLASPANNATVAGTATIMGTASDNVKVASVTLRVDDKWVTTDETAPYSFTLDTKKYKDGKHTLILRAWDAAGNMGQSQIITVNVKNTPSTSDDTYVPPTNGGTTVINADAPADKPILVTGTVAITPTKPGSSIQVWVDGKKQPTNTIDTARLTDGTHTVVISEDGQKVTKQIRVDNSLPIAAFNHVKAYALPYSVSAATVLLALVGWVARPYIFGITSWRERQLIKDQRRIK